LHSGLSIKQAQIQPKAQIEADTALIVEAELESMSELNATEGQFPSVAFSVCLVVAVIVSKANWNLPTNYIHLPL